MIRQRPQLCLSDRTFRAAEGGFLFMLVLALCVGWQSAALGLSQLSTAISPSGMLAAEASGYGAGSVVQMNTPVFAESLYAPTVLYPVKTQTVPGWMHQAAIRTAPVPAAETADAPSDAPVVEPGATAVNPRVLTSLPSKPLPPGVHPAIAIVIDDLGADPSRTRRVAALPPEIAMSFLPYADSVPQQAQMAAAAGHDVMVHMPMQAEAYRHADPGPMALRVDLPQAEIVRRLDWALARVPGFIGVNNHMGSRFTETREAMMPAMRVLAERARSSNNFFFFDSVTSPRSVGTQVARSFGMVSAGRDIFLDDTQTAAEVSYELGQLEHIARTRGVALAIGHPHDVTLSVLERWCANLKGFRLVHVRDAIRMKTEHEQGVPMAALSQPQP